jgi:peptidoglycan hydrolase-like protein with peptidoglycan-binding domain
MSEANRRQMQEALSGLGYYKGPVDGIFRRGTRTAIRHFQRDIKAAATGHLTADEATRLVTARWSGFPCHHQHRIVPAQHNLMASRNLADEFASVH